jgi:hypothetical protein
MGPNELLEILRSLKKEIVYRIFRINYNQSAYIWLSLGLKPKLNRKIVRENRLYTNIDRLPLDITEYITQFIHVPKNPNYEKLITFACIYNILRNITGYPGLSYTN